MTTLKSYMGDGGRGRAGRGESFRREGPVLERAASGRRLPWRVASLLRVAGSALNLSLFRVGPRDDSEIAINKSHPRKC